jgi:hypothetical protein
MIKVYKIEHKLSLKPSHKNDKQLGFFSLALRLVETRRQVVHMTPSRRSREDQVENGRIDTMGCVRPCYHYFAVFIILDHMSILIFYLDL